jgi:hypothetical protein
MKGNRKLIIVNKLEIFSLGMYLIGSILFVAGATAAIIVKQLQN